MSFLNKEPHRRYNILTGEWLLISPHRMNRPWQGQVEKPAAVNNPSYDESCYLCPGNTRANGNKTEIYTDTYVFDNDFSALLLPSNEEEEKSTSSYDMKGLLKAKKETGICRVICFSPKHNQTVADLSVDEIHKVIDTWTDQYLQLSKLHNISYIQIFENKGSMMGCSNMHPHGQLWASSSIPTEPLKETVSQSNYYTEHGRSLLSDYVNLEREEKQRIVIENDHFICLVPFWAYWPFETMIISKEHKKSLLELSEEEKTQLAQVIKAITSIYDRIFGVSFPYAMGIHQSPVDEEHPEWHFHIHFYPPLLRSGTVKKFTAAFELLAELQRDLTVESVAAKLRDIYSSLSL